LGIVDSSRTGVLLAGALTAANLRQEFKRANPVVRPRQITGKIQFKTSKILALQGATSSCLEIRRLYIDY